MVKLTAHENPLGMPDADIDPRVVTPFILFRVYVNVSKGCSHVYFLGWIVGVAMDVHATQWDSTQQQHQKNGTSSSAY